MSNRVSSLVYSRQVGSPVRKAVLVYCADRASDDGSGVFASKTTMAMHLEFGRSTVIRTINELVAEGILVPTGKRRCRTGATIVYSIDLSRVEGLPKLKDDTGAQAEKYEAQGVPERDTSHPGSGPHAVPERDPSRSGTQAVPERDPMPSQSGTQTILRTIPEPSNESSKAEDPVSIIAQIAGQEAAQSFAAYRRQMKKPLSLTAARRLVKALSQIEAEGGNAADALGMAEERGWQTVKPDWYFSRSKHEQNERPYHPASQRRDKPLRAASAGDAFAERLAFVGSSRRSPETDWGFG